MTAIGIRRAGSARARSVVPPATVIRLALARGRVELLRYAREPLSVVLTFAYPLLMLVLFAGIFGEGGMGAIPEGIDVTFPQYFLPGMIATGIVLSAFQAIATQIAADREEGALKRLRGTPLPTLSYFGGIVVQVLVTSTVQVTLLLAVANLAFGVPMPVGAGRWFTLVWLFLLGNAACATAGIAFSSLLRSARSANGIIVPVVLTLQFLSGVFFPFSSLPAWMQNVASLFPLKWLAQGMRSVFLPEQMGAAEMAGGWEHGRTALVLAAWLIGSLVVAFRYFGWLRRDER